MRISNRVLFLWQAIVMITLDAWSKPFLAFETVSRDSWLITEEWFFFIVQEVITKIGKTLFANMNQPVDLGFAQRGF